MARGPLINKFYKLAIDELLLEVDGPIDQALYAWASAQDPGVVKAFVDRFLCDRLRDILVDRARLIQKNLPEELEMIGGR